MVIPVDVATGPTDSPGGPTEQAAARGRSAGQRVARAAGELLITIGVVVVLFVVWQLWWTNLDAVDSQQQAVTEMARDFGGPVLPVAPDDGGNGQAGTDGEGGRDGAGADADDDVSWARTAGGTWTGSYGPPPVADPPGYGEPIAIVYVPRFGADYARPVMQGTGADVLDTLGLGHYPSTAMPGQVGNFAVAGHRQTNGKVLDLIHTLVPGDRVHVRTAEGYYTYVFRSSEIVTPADARVLAPVPSDPGAAPTERLLTLTTCHPRYGSTERYIGHAVLESWRPATAGPPAEIAGAVAASAGSS